MANGMKVLVVDDSQNMRRIAVSLLRLIGLHHIEDAVDGATALQALRSKKFDLVISDLCMEPMSGLDLLKEIRRTPEFDTVPFIVMTADTRPDGLAKALDAGASGFILKPFDDRALKWRIDQVLRRAAPYKKSL